MSIANRVWLVRLAWFVVAVAGIVSVIMDVTVNWKLSDTICHAVATCSSSQLNVSAARSLDHHGISIGIFATYFVVTKLVVVASFYGLGGLIMWRKPRDRGAIVAAIFLTTFILALNFSFTVGIGVLVLFGLLFPDGQYAPKWTRWLGLATIIGCVLDVFSDTLASAIIFPLMLPVPVLQVYRFRSVSSWAQRQQIKWALFGLAATIFGFGVLIATFIWAPWQTANGSLYSGFASAASPLLIAAIPISLAISVLRSRLWDIDKIISRALAYTSLSIVLAAIYVGGVIGLEALFGTLVGNGSAAAIAVSTLAIVALFGPMRRRIQSLIDRRFYRSRYDAARTVAAFGDRLRDQVDIAHLSMELRSVVQETLHPEHVALWLRER